MTTAARNNFGFGCNPIIRKMHDKAGTATADVAGYKGVARKTAFFLLENFHAGGFYFTS